jgi:hypothetical protein
VLDLLKQIIKEDPPKVCEHAPAMPWLETCPRPLKMPQHAPYPFHALGLLSDANAPSACLEAHKFASECSVAPASSLHTGPDIALNMAVGKSVQVVGQEQEQASGQRNAHEISQLLKACIFGNSKQKATTCLSQGSVN